jgi:hypothetical protein
MHVNVRQYNLDHDGSAERHNGNVQPNRNGLEWNLGSYYYRRNQYTAWDIQLWGHYLLF